MYLRTQAQSKGRGLERGRKAKFLASHPGDEGPITLPEPKAAAGASFPAQRAFVDGRIRTFNGKEWL